MDMKLDSEEQEILEAFEQGELHSSPDADLKLGEAVEAARNTLQKTRRVNLRMSERDFHFAHIRAQEEGLPYQTLLASINTL